MVLASLGVPGLAISPIQETNHKKLKMTSYKILLFATDKGDRVYIGKMFQGDADLKPRFVQ